jgi:formyl-CoA transferase
MLAEFGAEVIKVESPDGGDPLRKWRVLKDGTSLWWSVQARNKKSLTLNMKHAQGREIARKLALEADIIIENYRPGVLEKWELGYEQLKAGSVDHHGAPVRLRPDRADEGPAGLRRHRRIDGRLALRVRPCRPSAGARRRSIGDSVAALHGVIGAMMALRHRDATGGKRKGEGQMVDVACTNPSST